MRVIDQKLKKVAELRTDSRVIRESLDSLSTFYDARGNTLESRRSLRADIEHQGLRLARDFIGSFSSIEKQFDALYEQVEGLSEGCGRVRARLEATEARTAKFMAETQALQGRREALDARSQAVKGFLAKYQLTEEETAAIHTQRLERDGGTRFFEVLSRVQNIRKECKELLKTGSHGAGVEIYESMAQHQQVAHERLYTWVQQQCPDVDSEMPDSATGALLRRALFVLRERPAFYRHCQDVVTTARRNALARRFITALTRGGPNGMPRPIEVHAHDPQRYVGDMLAWIHQSIATERELVTAYFGTADTHRVAAARGTRTPAADGASAEAETGGEEEKKGSGDGAGDGGEDDATAAAAPTTLSSEETILTILTNVFEGVAAPLRVRLQQVLDSRPGLVVTFRISDLISFYSDTLGRLLKPGTGIVRTVEQCREAAKARFMDQLTAQAQKLVNSPPSYAADLAPSLTVLDVISRLEEVLRVLSNSMVPADAREAAASPVITSFVDPLLRMSRLSAEGLDTTDTCVYLINNITAMQSALVPFEFTSPWVRRLAQELERWEEALVSDQTRCILSECGITAKLGAIATHDGTTPLNEVPGMDLASVSASLKSFYSALFTLDFGAFDRLLNPRLQARAQRGVAQLLATAYQNLYEAMLRPANGYEDPQALLLHSPAQVRNLLDLDDGARPDAEAEEGGLGDTIAGAAASLAGAGRG